MTEEQMQAIAKDAAKRVHANGGCVPQLAFAPILFALQDAISRIEMAEGTRTPGE